LDWRRDERYPSPTKSYEDAINDKFLILHTSGSTGFPKPVEVSHGLIATIDAQQDLREVDGRRPTTSLWANKIVYSALPPFHSAAINWLGFSIFQNTQLLLGPSDAPPSIAILQRILELRIAQMGMLLPVLLQDIVAESHLLPLLSRWEGVCYGGAMLQPEIGDAICEHTKIFQNLGSTETFNLPELEWKDKKEWFWNRFHPDLNVEFVPVDDDSYELFFRRDQEKLKHQGAFWTFPDRDSYSMGDLYKRHPTEPGLWMHCGRKDDIIVLANGEKLNPRAAENVISQHPEIRSALVIGSGRTQVAVLAELRPGSTLPVLSAQEQTKALLPSIRKANEISPGHAQIDPYFVRWVKAGTFLRSSKGEIQRKKTLKENSSIIEEIYEHGENPAPHTARLNLDSLATLQESLRKLVVAQWFPDIEITDDQQLFDLGLDSLQAARLTRAIKAALWEHDKSAASKLTIRTIYEFPTIHGLATAVMRLSHELNGQDEHEAKEKRMAQALDKFYEKLAQIPQRSTKCLAVRSGAVILTGTTGSLGSYILDCLIRNDTVQQVICLNRAKDARDRQHETNSARGLSTDFAKVKFLPIDVSANKFGLSSDAYEDLRNRGSHIIHNAWPVNFNMPLADFESQFEGCLNLIKLSCESSHDVPITFLSSVGAANNWSTYHETGVPEEAIEDLRVSEDMGYAESKQIAELLFARACETHGIRADICRVGQIAGPVDTPEQGMWAPNEWFPSLLLSSRTMNKIPRSLGAMDRIDWIPVDVLAATIVELAVPSRLDSTLSSLLSRVPLLGRLFERVDFTQEAQGASFIHLVNHRRSDWSDLVPRVVSSWRSDIKIVSYDEWLEALVKEGDRRGGETNDAEDNLSVLPAMKLIDFFRSIDVSKLDSDKLKRAEYTTDKAMRRSRTFEQMRPVSADWILLWLRQLNYT
jgi:thioester reductase-like protein/acyl-CoA synthetase (AMP-forming)/AMP-acid ligase II